MSASLIGAASRCAGDRKHHTAAIIIQGVGYLIDSPDVPPELIKGDVSRKSETIAFPPQGASVFYGAIFSYCPRCGAKISLSELGSKP